MSFLLEEEEEGGGGFFTADGELRQFALRGKDPLSPILEEEVGQGDDDDLPPPPLVPLAESTEEALLPPPPPGPIRHDRRKNNNYQRIFYHPKRKLPPLPAPVSVRSMGEGLNRVVCDGKGNQYVPLDDLRRFIPRGCDVIEKYRANGGDELGWLVNEAGLRAIQTRFPEAGNLLYGRTQTVGGPEEEAAETVSKRRLAAEKLLGRIRVEQAMHARRRQHQFTLSVKGMEKKVVLEACAQLR